MAQLIACSFYVEFYIIFKKNNIKIKNNNNKYANIANYNYAILVIWVSLVSM